MPTTANLPTHSQEEEIFRVDHYLGKAGVSAITDFRTVDPLYERFALPSCVWLQSHFMSLIRTHRLLSRENVLRVEVAIHETIDCAGDLVACCLPVIVSPAPLTPQ